MLRKVLVSVAACAAVLSAVAVPAASAGADPVPHCQPVLFEQASGNYTRQWCDTGLSQPPAGEEHVLAVSGGNIETKGTVVLGEGFVTKPSPTPSPSGSGTIAPVAKVSSSYPNPNGPHYHCIEQGHLYAWICISGYGFLYGSSWAFVSDFYQHPKPITDYVVNESYFNQNSPNGMTDKAQWRHRVIAVNDGPARGLIEPFKWKVDASTNNPPAPVNCLVLTGPDAGQLYACTKADQTSILDYWHQANVIPNQIGW